MAPPIPVTVLSGFLGSGKTTLLNWLLRAEHGLRIAVIVNELGAVGIDGALVPQGERFVTLDNGCLCCALNEDLEATLTELVAQPGVDHVVIETTGLADPLPVAWTCTRPALSQRLRVDAVVTVVDAGTAQLLPEQSIEARMQIERADILLLNKLDLTDDGGEAAAAALRARNPEAPLLRATHAEVPWHLILGQQLVLAPASARGPEAPSSAGHSHEHGAEAGAHAHAAPSFASWSWTQPAAEALDEAAIEAMCYDVPASVFRFKGLLFVDAPEGPWLLVNAVAGRIDLRFLTPERPPTHSVWVFFGRTLDTQLLAQLCARGRRA